MLIIVQLETYVEKLQICNMLFLLYLFWCHLCPQRRNKAVFLDEKSSDFFFGYDRYLHKEHLSRKKIIGRRAK